MKTLLWSKETCFKDAIRLLDENGNGFLALVDSRGSLLGILTDGDVRRAILSDLNDLHQIVNKSPEVAQSSTPRKTIISRLRQIHRKHMPVVDQSGRLMTVVSLDEEEFNLKPNWVVLMAGGLGSRLGELTKDKPKPMLELGGKPMLEHIIDMFVADGFTKFMISVNYKSEVIKDYFKDGTNLGIEIKYLEETKRLGTGGALSLIDIELNEPFFVTNGDVLTTLSYSKILEFHTQKQSVATMCVKEEEYQIPYGVIEADSQNNILSMEEKPVKKFFINTGMYVLDPQVINHVPKGEFFDLPSLFQKLNDLGHPTKAFEITDYWIDLGHPSDYNLIRNKFSHL